MPKRKTREVKDQEAEQAIAPPRFMQSIIGEGRERVGLPEPEPEQEAMLIDFAQSEVWALIKSWMDEMRDEYRNAMAIRAAQPGQPLDEIGFRYLVANEVQHVLDTLEQSITMAYENHVAKLEAEEGQAKDEKDAGE